MLDDLQAALEKVLKSYETYYNINRETPVPPFAAEAEFRLHDERYFLIRSARLDQIDSREHVFFAAEEHLDPARLAELDGAAWQEGLDRVELTEYHRNTDVILLILAKSIDPEAARMCRKLRHYKSYRMGLKGWSNYRLIAYDLSSKGLYYNRQGEFLKKVFGNMETK